MHDQVGRGPPREPRRVVARARRRRDGQARARRRRPHPRRAPRPPRGRRLVPRRRHRRHRAVRGDALPGPVPHPEDGLAVPRSCGRTRAGAARTAARGCSSRSRARRSSTSRRAPSGIDPLELRRRNVVHVGELPYFTATGMPLDRVTPEETLEQAVEHRRLRRVPRRAGARVRGRAGSSASGIGLYVEPTSTAMRLARHRGRDRPRSSPSGTVTRVPGHRRRTVRASRRRWPRSSPSTSVSTTTTWSSCRATPTSTPFGGGTGGSRTAVIAGSAARDASLQVREMALERRRAPPRGRARGPRARRRRGVGAGHAGRATSRSPRSRASPTTAGPELPPGIAAGCSRRRVATRRRR